MASARRSFLVTVVGPDADGFRSVVAVDEAGEQVGAAGDHDRSVNELLTAVVGDLARAARADAPRFR